MSYGLQSPDTSVLRASILDKLVDDNKSKRTARGNTQAGSTCCRDTVVLSLMRPVLWQPHFLRIPLLFGGGPRQKTHVWLRVRCQTCKMLIGIRIYTCIRKIVGGMKAPVF